MAEYLMTRRRAFTTANRFVSYIITETSSFIFIVTHFSYSFSVATHNHDLNNRKLRENNT